MFGDNKSYVKCNLAQLHLLQKQNKILSIFYIFFSLNQGFTEIIILTFTGLNIITNNMSKEKIQQDKSLYNDAQWGEVRSSILRQYVDTDKQTLVNDQVLIQQQSELMQQIKQKIKKSRMKDVLGSMQVLPIDSSISNISSAYNYADDQSFIKNKFTEEFQSSLVNSALKEVKGSCSDETYETVRNYIMNNKQKECENLLKSLQKKNKEIEELSLSMIMKQNQLCKLKEEIAPYIAKAEYFEEEKKKLKKKSDQNMQKEIMLHKIERSLIFKEKMLQEAKKRGEKLKEFYDGIFARMKKIEVDLTTLRISIQQKMQQAQSMVCCSEGNQNICWKKDVMKRFRQKLLEQREILKQQQKQLEKRYQALELVSQQCKKLVNQSYQGIISSLGSGNSNLNVGSKQDKNQKPSSFSMMSPDAKRFVI